MMSSAEIRQSFLDFFALKKHTPVASASLLPQSPGLLFTNAGMNQFVPYFLGVEKPPYSPARACDTQKCIRAGGKHNDLDDVGYDTYHHTFFEMLGNWSFGDYFKEEVIAWSWELLVEHWGVPAERVYATVYAPDKEKGDPGDFDQEAWDLWAVHFRKAGLDPEKHIVDGNVQDNFWMMGETGPCGPCSELHVDLTPNADTGGKLVNGDSDLCIEIWNLVFIQFNAEADGSFRDLPAKHIDTGMGFERAVSLIQNTKNFTDFSQKPSNYATDVFQTLFRKIEELSGQKYRDIYPEPEADRSAFSEEMKSAIAFRVIADHLRTLSFSIADGILPGNNGRNYVLRRILRRAVRYGRQLGFSGEKPFFGDLVSTLVAQVGGVFPELVEREAAVRVTLEREETSFNETLDHGIINLKSELAKHLKTFFPKKVYTSVDASDRVYREHRMAGGSRAVLSGEVIFELKDTFGFPVDLTEIIADENDIDLDLDKYQKLMEAQRERARAARKSSVVRALDISSEAYSAFVGFEEDRAEALVLEIHRQGDSQFVITDTTPFYAEMGGQVADSGVLVADGIEHEVTAVQQVGAARAHAISKAAKIEVGDRVRLRLDHNRRRKIEAHHSATHLLHWALHEVVSQDATQQGSAVDEQRLRFDFNCGALGEKDLREMEKVINERIAAGDSVSWVEVPHAEVKDRPDVMQFFGDKYGDKVRVVQIGGAEKALNGYAMELCGGTHVKNTAEVGLFKIKSEGAIASGVRRIEAVCGEAAWTYLNDLSEEMIAAEAQLREKLAQANDKLATLGEKKMEVGEMPRLMEAMLVGKADVGEMNQVLAAYRDKLDELKKTCVKAEKALKKRSAASAAKEADATLADLMNKGGAIVTAMEGEAALLQELLHGLKKKNFAEGAFLIVDDGEKLHLGAYCGEAARGRGLKAGDLLRELAALADGKGGGKADMARGAAPLREKLPELKETAREKLA